METRGGPLEQFGQALSQTASRAAWRLLSLVFDRSREPEKPPEDLNLQEPEPVQTPDVPVETEGPAADTDSLLHRLAAGDQPSSAGKGLCQRLIEENRGYQPESVLEAAFCEGQFNPEDMERIAVFLVSAAYEPGADGYVFESAARRVFETVAAWGVVTPELVKRCVRAMADAPCVTLTRPAGEYLKTIGGTAAQYRSLVIEAFTQEDYSTYRGKQPAAGPERARPATWNEWEGREAWSEAGQD